MKKTTKSYVIALIIIAVIGSILYFGNGSVVSNQTIYANGAFATMQLKTNGFLSNLFKQQTFTTSKQTYKLTDSVVVNSQIMCFDSVVKPRVILETSQGGFSFPITASKMTVNTLYSSSFSFKPSRTGDLQITHCWDCGDSVGRICDLPQTVTIVNAVTSCTQPKHIGATVDSSRVDSSGSTIQQIYCDQWERYSLPDCTASRYCDSYKTYCWDGYLIQGTQDTTANSKSTCVAPTSSANPDAVVPMPPAPVDTTSQPTNTDVSALTNNSTPSAPLMNQSSSILPTVLAWATVGLVALAVFFYFRRKR